MASRVRDASDHPGQTTWLRVLLGLALGLVLVLTAPAPSRADTPLWASLAAEDLRAIHDAIRDNHPGPVDPQNPHYRTWLEHGLVEASTEARRARSYSDYIRALRRYTNGFQDGHLTIDPVVAPKTMDWAGFVVGGDSGAVPEVISAEPDSGVKVGDRVESCDGRSTDALMKARVDPYFWNSAIPQARMSWAGELFIADPDEADRRLKSCRFSSGEVRLNWRTLAADEVGKRFAAALGSGAGDYSLRQIDGVWFVRLPAFWFASDDDRKKLEALVETLKARAPELRKAKVVLDVRGNGGGDSIWGIRVVAALWGEAWTNRVEASFDNTHDFRVSPANERRVSEVLANDKANHEAEAIPYWTLVEAAFQKARTTGSPLAHIDLPPDPPADPPPPDPISGHVYLLTDPRCASACLDFADLVLRLPHATQIGGPTSADAIYIDVNELPLPSGLTNVIYGMKVFRHRVRANNQWYEPQLKWPGGPMTDEAIARWVKTLD